MALESTSLQVRPANENNALMLMQSFGWTLLSSQEIFNRSQKFTGTTWNSWGATDNYETKETHYIKMVFQRDTNMVNYQKLVQLEKEYDNLESPKWVSSEEPKYYHPNLKNKQLIAIMLFIGMPFLIIGIAAIIVKISGTGMQTADDFLPMVVLGILGSILTVAGVSFIKGNKKKVEEAKETHVSRVNDWRIRYEQYKTDKNTISQKREQIVKEAKTLLT